jgi:hypothetical protein
MFTWQRDKQLATLKEYGRGAGVSEHWRRSICSNRASNCCGGG